MENKAQKQARLELAELIILIMAELFKISDRLPNNELPRYLPDSETIPDICRMDGPKIFAIGVKLHRDTAAWQNMPDGTVIVEDHVISKGTLHSSLRARLQDVAHEFDIRFIG